MCCTAVEEVTHHKKSARGGQSCWNVVICELSTSKRSRYHGSLKESRKFVISGVRRGVNEICTLLGLHAA